MAYMQPSSRVKRVVIAALAVVLPATAALAAYNATNWYVSNTIGVGTDIPRHRLSAIGGPFWTSNRWLGSVELGSAGAIAWRANASGWLFGMGASNSGFSVFRTTSNTATTTAATVTDFFINNLGRVGLGSVAPAHRLSIGTGPAWTSSGWSGAVDLLNGAAIGWRPNGGGKSVGIGHTDSGLYIFRTTSAPGTTGSAPIYDVNISDDGDVGIGAAGSPGYKLHVVGTTWVQGGNFYVTDGSIFVGGTQMNVPDYVFEPGYELKTLDELRTFIADNKHLPNVPSAKDVQAGKLDLAGFQMHLLEKIEELTLYTLAQDDRLNSQQRKIVALEQENEATRQRLAAIEARLAALPELAALTVSPSAH